MEDIQLTIQKYEYSHVKSFDLFTPNINCENKKWIFTILKTLKRQRNFLSIIKQLIYETCV